jgi:gliding motility-associated-like protein
VTATNNGPVCESATFGLGASNVSGATSYTWSGPGGFSSTTQSPNGLTAPATNGTYTYTVSVNSSSGTCSASTTLTVNDVTAVPTVSVAAPTCSANGTASVSNYAGGLTYTFSPSGPTVGVTGVISSMSPGTNYTLTASSGSCTSTASTPFSIAAQLITPATPLITTNPPTCAAPGNAALTNYDGAVSYTFSPAGPSINAADGVISGMITGTSYTLSATNGSCTATSAPFSISDQLTTPPTPIISSTAETCTADGAASVSNYSGTYTYAFSPAGPSVDGAGMISGMSFGTSYMVTATDGVCTSTASSPFNINQQLAVPVLTLVGQSVCSPNIVDITSPSVSSTDIGTLSYYTDAALTLAVATPTAVGSGTYYVEAVSGACSTSGSLAITVTTTPTLTLNDQSICSPNTIDLTDPSIATSDVGTMSYYTDVALTMPVSNPSAVGAGTYYLEATNGSCSFSGSIDVVVTTTPTLTLVSQNICSPNTTDLTSPTVSSTDVGTLAYYSDATLTTVLSNPSAVGNGIYYVEATNGTCASNGSITVTVTTTPTLTLNDQSICSPNTIDLTDPSIATSDVGTMSYYTNVALTMPVSNPSAVGAGTYYLEATNGSCSFSGVLDVLVTTTPTLTLVSQSTCTPYTVDLTSPSVVSVDLGTLTYYSDAALTSVVADPTAVGTGVYYVEAVNGICSSNGSLTVTITTTPTLTLVDQTVCSPATVDLTDPAVSSTDVGSLAYYSDLSLTTPIVDPTSVGTGAYYVEATNGSCTFSGVLDVTVKDLPVISANAPAVSCGSYTLPAITGAFILNESYWTGTNQTGTQYQAGDVLTSSITLYMYAGSTGCSDEESFLITVNPLPTVTSLNNGAVYCQGDNIVPIEAVVTGSADWVIDYTLDGLPLSVTASSSPVSLGNNSGVYVLTSISDANCSNVADGSQIIEINPCEIVIPSAFTPNGDMMNDFWEIIYLDDVYPESQISVYNRWGEKVYESEKGQYATKPWDGTFNGTLLPVASYFYILDPGDGSDKRNGTVSIILKK